MTVISTPVASGRSSESWNPAGTVLPGGDVKWDEVKSWSKVDNTVSGEGLETVMQTSLPLESLKSGDSKFI